MHEFEMYQRQHPVEVVIRYSSEVIFSADYTKLENAISALQALKLSDFPEKVEVERRDIDDSIPF